MRFFAIIDVRSRLIVIYQVMIVNVEFGELISSSCSDLLRAVDWLVCYTMEKCLRKVESLSVNTGLSSFDVKNAAQVYHLRTLSIVYIEVTTRELLFHPVFFVSFSEQRSFASLN